MRVILTVFCLIMNMLLIVSNVESSNDVIFRKSGNEEINDNE